MYETEIVKNMHDAKGRTDQYLLIFYFGGRKVLHFPVEENDLIDIHQEIEKKVFDRHNQINEEDEWSPTSGDM